MDWLQADMLPGLNAPFGARCFLALAANMFYNANITAF